MEFTSLYAFLIFILSYKIASRGLFKKFRDPHVILKVDPGAWLQKQDGELKP
jgi:hypothetical protein